MKRKIDSRVEDLFFAVETNDLRAAKKLLAKGVDVNTRDQGDSTPLMRAAANGNHEMAQVFLVHGAEVNI